MKKEKLFDLSILDDIYYKVDNDGKILEISPSIEKVLGYKADEIIGTYAKDLYVDPSQRDEILKNKHSKNKDFNFESLIRHKNGEHLIMSDHSHFLRDNLGNIIGVEGITRDITQQNKLYTKLVQSEKKYQVIFENSPSGIVYFDTQGVVVDVNQAALHIFGVEKDKFIGFNLIEKLRDKKLVEVIKESLVSGKAYYKNIYLSLYSKKRIYLDAFFRAIRNENDEIISVVASLDDKSAEYEAIKRLEKSKEEWKSIIDNMLNIFVQTNENGIIQKVSPSIKELLGYEVDEIIGKSILSLWQNEEEKLKYRVKYLKNLKPVKNKEAYVVHKNGKVILMNANITPRFSEDGTYIGSDNFMQDITDLKKSEEKIRYMATHDDLTSLPNRSMLSNTLRYMIDKAKRNKHDIAILFLDLDDFKKINDNFGHQEGDKVLIETANRFKKVLGENDFVCRFGGDEFVIVLEHIKDNEDIVLIAQKLKEIFLKAFHTQAYTHYLSCSIGITTYPNDALSPEKLLKNADTAMYDAKKKGKNRFSFYLKELGEKIEKELYIESLLRGALQKNEFELFYQPQISLKESKVVGLEALIRWNSSELGFVGPDNFISIAEKTRMIIPIGDWILKSACQQIKKWHDSGLYEGNVSVNVSGIQLNNSDLITTLENALAESGLNPKFLDLEITESILMDNTKNWLDLFDRIKDMSVDISIDDFGTGYSSLSYLKQFPADELKVDKSFIDDVPYKKDANAIVKTIIALAKNLGYKSVAEGVETVEQKEYLEQEGCDIIQGFYFSKPLCVKDLENYILNF